MPSLKVITPTSGCRVVESHKQTLLFGQPPEVLKGLMSSGIKQFDTLVLLDSREKQGSLLNNLEFPLYFFLFFSNGLAQGRKLNLIGEETVLSQMMRLLRFTLFGPNEVELQKWATNNDLKNEWLAVSQALALKNSDNAVLQLSDFFNLIPFKNNSASLGSLNINHIGYDQFIVQDGSDNIQIDFTQELDISPAYNVAMDYVSSGLVKFGLEVLGGASGFSQNEPCTGIALCHNGDYLLIDSIPFLDQHLYARGIAKNQISAVFLTHLHDDHCSMFPLMLMPHKVDIITTKEIFNMALEKLSCQLGWHVDVIRGFFNFIEIDENKSINYYGLGISAHVTVHSIPTIGATFSLAHQGVEKTICVIGDNHSMAAIQDMAEQNIVRQSTNDNLHQIFKKPFDLLVADGGAGAIHGDPIDALESEADRIVFVHVDALPETLTTTFSLASSGKRYTLFDGDSGIYTAQISYYLSKWLGQEFPSRWMRCLLAEHEILKYNRDDVVIVQGAPTKGCVYLLLTGYCDVIYQQGESRLTVAKLQAGNIIGEMAVVSGESVRNASVVARTPMTICVLKENTFNNFIQHGGVRDDLMNRWQLRPIINKIPQFTDLSSTVLESICRVCNVIELPKGQTLKINDDTHTILVSGDAVYNDNKKQSITAKLGDEFGFNPFIESQITQLDCLSNCVYVQISADNYLNLIDTVPAFNYQSRKINQDKALKSNWLLGQVDEN